MKPRVIYTKEMMTKEQREVATKLAGVWKRLKKTSGPSRLDDMAAAAEDLCRNNGFNDITIIEIKNHPEKYL